MVLNQNDIVNLEQRYRVAFINSLAGFRQAVLLGTKSKSGIANLAIFNSLIHLGANPALFGFISRPDTVPRDTLANIMETNEYTFNYMPAAQYEKAHQTSARYESHVSEFSEVGFQESYSANIFAPFVDEAIVKIGMRYEDKIDIKINGTVMIIGSLQHIELNDKMVEADGYVDLCQEEILISCGLDAYFKPTLIGRLSYAKPDTLPVKI
jgi:flavin reductase (DIM6/NTAB) family NADH-FMN oxidoreductase RutF